MNDLSGLLNIVSTLCPGLEPPLHMTIQFGPVTTKKVSSDARSRVTPATRVSAADPLDGTTKFCTICHSILKVSLSTGNMFVGLPFMFDKGTE